jgi:VIT1/CCC1 family predicted Fe2+/Mn2+ transporter
MNAPDTTPAKSLSTSARGQMLDWQRAEITEHHIYLRLADAVKDPHNSSILSQIARDEASHYKVFKRYTGLEVEPNRVKVLLYYWIARLFGLTFGMKLMQRGEESAQDSYGQLRGQIPEMDAIIHDEEEHEQHLLGMLDEEVLKYTGSVVLGLNDALVELTGALAGLTLAFQNTRLIALSGLITGISASFSMAASEYLSARAEGGDTSPMRSAVYTGIAYVMTVAVLVFPYLVLDNYLYCLLWTLVNAILVIAAFNYYLAVAKDLPFGRRFLGMAIVSLGVAVFSFGVGYLIRHFFNIDL